MFISLKIQGVQQILNDLELANSLSKAGKHCIAGDFNWKNIVAEWRTSVGKLVG